MTTYIVDLSFTEDEADALEDGIMLLDEFTKRDGEYTPDYEFPGIKHMRSILEKIRRKRTPQPIPVNTTS